MTAEQIVDLLRNDLRKLAENLPDTAGSALIYQLDSALEPRAGAAEAGNPDEHK